MTRPTASAPDPMMRMALPMPIILGECAGATAFMAVAVQRRARGAHSETT